MGEERGEVTLEKENSLYEEMTESVVIGECWDLREEVLWELGLEEYSGEVNLEQ